MSSRPERRRFTLSLLALVLLLSCGPAQASGEFQAVSEPEAWLVTYGPGQIYWQRFGHNAIWLRDPELGLDHVFNFGFFDFGQEDFFLRFLQGRMLYFSLARPSREEFADYINENRSIRVQRLDLSLAQKLALTEFLLGEVRPENREYLYDYYLNNCSTRIRDAIDLALGGLLESGFRPQAANLSWRDHTRRLTSADFWLYLGLQVGLGSPVDAQNSRWDEMFIPGVLADAMAETRFTGSSEFRPLVLEDVLLYESAFEPPPDAPLTRWPVYLLASLGALLGAWLLSRPMPPVLVPLLARSWLVFSGLVGLGLLYLWFGTNHAVARDNVNVLVFFPPWIFLAFWKGHEKTSFRIVAALSALALAWIALPPQQYNLDVLAFFLPLNLGAAAALQSARHAS